MESTGDKTTRKGTEQKFIEGICNGMAKKPTEMKRKGMVRKRIGTELIGADMDLSRTAKLWRGEAPKRMQLKWKCVEMTSSRPDKEWTSKERLWNRIERNGTKPRWSGVDSR